MEFISILIWLIQIALIIHVLKTGASRFWILILIFMPLIGGLAYFVIELLPQLSGSITDCQNVEVFECRRCLDPDYVYTAARR